MKGFKEMSNIIFTLAGATIVVSIEVFETSAPLLLKPFLYDVFLITLSTVFFGTLISGIVASALKKLLNKNWDAVFNKSYALCALVFWLMRIALTYINVFN